MPDASRPDLIEGLAECLRDANFEVDALRELWGPVADAALGRGNSVPAHRVLHRAEFEQTPLALLARIFLLADAVPTARLEAAFPVFPVQSWLDVGLLSLTGDAVVGTVDLRPYAFADEHGVGQWWICSDRGELGRRRPLREDHVLGVGGATLTLTRIMHQQPVARALDLGTGCGIQAMHAARFARAVVATDLSERAVAFGRFNAALNGIGSIDFRVGDLFDPVRGEQFDLIVSNPPFVITPRRPGIPEYIYRDGGGTGDDLVRRVVEGSARHLAPGGVAQFLGNWEYREGAQGVDRVTGWIEAARVRVAHLDALVIERTVQDPAEYAETWVRDGGTMPVSADYARLVETWLDDFEARKVEAIGFGFMVLRRFAPSIGSDLLHRSPVTRFDVAHADGPVGDAWSRSVLAALDAEAWLSVVDDDALCSSRLRVAADVTEERSYWPGSEDPSVIELRRGTGWVRSLGADSAEAALVGACDGELSVGAISDAIAQILDIDPVSLRIALVPRVRELVRGGYLVVSDPASSTAFSSAS